MADDVPMRDASNLSVELDNHRQKINETEQELSEVKQDLKKVNAKLDKLVQDLNKVNSNLDELEWKGETGLSDVEQKRLERLREDKRQLQTEKMLLFAKEKTLRRALTSSTPYSSAASLSSVLATVEPDELYRLLVTYVQRAQPQLLDGLLTGVDGLVHLLCRLARWWSAEQLSEQLSSPPLVQSAFLRTAPEMRFEDREEAIRLIRHAAERNFVHRNTHEKQAHTVLWGIGAVGMGKSRLGREALNHLPFLGKPPLYIFIDYRNGDGFHPMVDPLGAEVAFSVRLAARGFANMSLRTFCHRLGEIKVPLARLFPVFDIYRVMKALRKDLGDTDPRIVLLHQDEYDEVYSWEGNEFAPKLVPTGFADQVIHSFVSFMVSRQETNPAVLLGFVLLPFFTAPSRLGIRNQLTLFHNSLPPIGPLSSDSAMRIMTDICGEATLALPAFRRLLAACSSVPRALQLLRDQLFASGKPIPLHLTECEVYNHASDIHQTLVGLYDVSAPSLVPCCLCDSLSPVL